MSPTGSAGLHTPRGLRRSLAWLFCGLVLLVGAERRLADLHWSRAALTRVDRAIVTAAPLDGNDVALRLTAIDATGSVPTLAPAAAPRRLIVLTPVAPPSRSPGLPPLRAPPSPSRASL